MRRMICQLRRAGAFTLVELLVVIAVFTVLVAMLFPSIERSLQLARLTSCLDNLRQTGLGLECFVTDNNRVLPKAYFSTSGTNTLSTCGPTFLGAPRQRQWLGTLLDRQLAQYAQTVCPARSAAEIYLPSSSCKHACYSAAWCCDGPMYFLEYSYRSGTWVSATLPQGRIIGTATSVLADTWKPRFETYRQQWARKSYSGSWLTGSRILAACARDGWCGNEGGGGRYPASDAHGGTAPMLRIDLSAFPFRNAWPNPYVTAWNSQVNVHPTDGPWDGGWWEMADRAAGR